MKTFKTYLPDIVAVVLFAVISFAYFFPADTEGRILYQHDASAGRGAGQEVLTICGCPTTYGTCLPISWAFTFFCVHSTSGIRLQF